MADLDAAIADVYASLQGLRDGEVRPVVRRLATHYGVTDGTIYRWAGRLGLKWRSSPATKGVSRATPETLKAASALMYVSRRGNKQLTMPACEAKEILEDSGADIGVSTSRFTARLRETGLSAADLTRPTPHVHLLSDHPNHVWQFDVTNCLQYFLDGPHGMGERDADMELYKNKIVKTARSIRKELLRYAVVDHCTGAFYFRYFYASGERAIDGARFLFEAMRPKDDLIKTAFNGSSASKIGKYHFHGVPFVLVPDKGSIIAAKANQALLSSLKIDLRPHMPGNPRAKGSVEGLMHHLNSFEARLRLRRPSSLEELNAWALDRCIYVNAAKKMRNVAPRSALWSTIARDQLRLCPDEELYHLLVREPSIERTCDGSCFISVDGRAYFVPDTEAAHRKVIVSRHPFEYPSVEVHYNGNVWLCEPVERDRYGRLSQGVRYGEYKAPKHTEVQNAKTDMEQIAGTWGLTFKGTGDHRRAEAPPLGFESPLQVFGHQAEKVPENVQFIARTGTPMEIEDPAAGIPNPVRSHGAFEVAREIAPRLMSTSDFLSRLASEIGPIPRALNQAVRAAYPEGVEAASAGGIIDDIREGTWQPLGIGETEAIHG